MNLDVVLLCCLRGQPVAEIALRMTGVSRNPADLDSVASTRATSTSTLATVQAVPMRCLDGQMKLSLL
jgi:hypothetical protein